MKQIICAAAILWALPPIAAMADGGVDYKEYKYSRGQHEYFEVTWSREQLSITVFEEDRLRTIAFEGQDVIKHKDKVTADGDVVFDSEGLVLDGQVYPYAAISDIRCFGRDKEITVTFLTRATAPERASRIRAGNQVSFSGIIEVQEDDFVRGVVLTIVGDVEVYGEVNRDIVALFGNVYLAPDAVARGDIASLEGRIDVARDASVYGEIYSGREGYRKRTHRFHRRTNQADFSAEFHYNRVDGATPLLSLEYADRDSVLPTVWAKGGYAFASEHWRWEFGLEQTVYRGFPILIGGRYYRRLASEDDWLLSDMENTVFALLVTEDFKDYYEAEGGTAWLTLVPAESTRLDFGYRHEDTRWLKAHKNLWSLFGGDKRFQRNFEGVETAFRDTGIAQIDTAQTSTFYASLDVDTRNQDDVFAKSAWHGTGEFEWSSKDWESDFDYRRYRFFLRRYQETSRHSMLILRAVYGSSDGYLPMHKRFFIGGLGTLRGYKHKECMGTQFVMANAEYRLAFPRSDFATSLFYDIGQIANNTALDDNAEVKQNLGLSLYFGDDLRINIAKRLDRGSNGDPQVYVRFEHVF